MKKGNAIVGILMISFMLSWSLCAMQRSFRALQTKAPLMSRAYKSRFVPPNRDASRVLVNGQILAIGEQPHEMMERVVHSIALSESLYDSMRPKKITSTATFIEQLGTHMDNGDIVFSTPILTNAGRFEHRPLSACVMPPIDLKSDLVKIKKMVNQYHQDGMGTGYDLTEATQPITMLKFLNEVATQGANSSHEQRPVGNMGMLDVNSPYIEEFIKLKVGADARDENWKFNLSVNISDEFMQAVEHDKEFTLKNGRKINAQNLFLQMAQAAHQCGDPGLISSSRLNKDNPTPLIGEYKTTAPCAEVGLAPGETCIFGYINLAKFVTNSEKPTIDFDRLRSVTYTLTRALDDALEISIQHYVIPESKTIMQAKRKIGIGICGYADMLIMLGLSYQEIASHNVLQDILNFINYNSKKASMQLAQERGSFGAIAESRYMDETFITDKYAVRDTDHVHATQWRSLAKNIKDTGMLRNASTIALPPTGRSAMVIGASQALEPLFSLNSNGAYYPILQAFLQKHGISKNSPVFTELQKTGRVPANAGLPKHCFITATEISPEDHLAVVTAAQGVIDESISKTINVPKNTTPEQIAAMYLKAYQANLKGITIYRDGSRTYQPKELSINNENTSNSK